MVNDSLTLAGIPSEVFAYRLGNRSALEWVIDQYRVKTDKRSGIRSDPNRLDDEKYIVRLVGQVVRVSLETVNIVRGLPEEQWGVRTGLLHSAFLCPLKRGIEGDFPGATAAAGATLRVRGAIIFKLRHH